MVIVRGEGYMAKKSQSSGNEVWYAIAIMRLALGFVFLWAFFDKWLGLGYSTTSAKAWLNGGSPTSSFLSHVEGPFADFFQALGSQAWVDWLFMLGLLGIGTSLLLGVVVRVGATAGSVLLLMMWMASLPITTNPVLDDHLVYITALIVICAGLDEQRWSITAWWQGLGFVKKNFWLQ